ERRAALRHLGQQATAQIELRRTVSELRRAVGERESAEAALRRALDSAVPPAPLPAPATGTRPGVLALAALMVPLALTLAGAQLQPSWEPRLVLAGGSSAACSSSAWSGPWPTHGGGRSSARSGSRARCARASSGCA